jgi:hypothetical protein
MLEFLFSVLLGLNPEGELLGHLVILFLTFSEEVPYVWLTINSVFVSLKESLACF